MIRIQPGQPGPGAPGKVLTRDPDAESRRATRDLVGNFFSLLVPFEQHRFFSELLNLLQPN